MSAVTARFASAFSRLLGVFGDAATFREQPVSVAIDRSPKPDRLPVHMLDLEEGVQAVFINLPVTDVAVDAPPTVGEYITDATHRYRIEKGIRHLGHAYELPCIASPLA